VLVFFRKSRIATRPSVSSSGCCTAWNMYAPVIRNLDDGKSQGGRIACLTNKTGHSVASWIFWESGTIKRVCRSSSASEFMSAVEGYDATMWLLALWKETSRQDLDALLVTDSGSLQQKAVSTALPTEKQLRIDMDFLRQGLRREEYGLVWAGSSRNLANLLTKGPRGISPRCRLSFLYCAL
jgi:hypothetical protein